MKRSAIEVGRRHRDISPEYATLLPGYGPVRIDKGFDRDPTLLASDLPVRLIAEMLLAI